MNANGWAILSLVLAYLIGAVPFGYLVARFVKGIDIRTVGSGNIGATNVGRVLGFRFFLIVFTLDLLKGFLPTFLFPKAVAIHSGTPFHDLGVITALATILGHNFPVYLKFRGGKGVATSLGALLALDWVASLSAAVGFGVSLRISRYVSLSSMLGGLVFLAVYLARVGNPLDREHRAMTIVTIALVILLFVRHRKNIGRLFEGTEPKVSFRRSREQPAGHAAWILVVILVMVAIAAVVGLSQSSQRKSVLTVGSAELEEVARVSTGHQRADRITFANGGKIVAVTCPRYDRLVLYRVTDELELAELQDIELEGKPVAVCASHDKLYVLERPSGDRRHVQPGWWEAFDFEGKTVGQRHLAGMYPDDLALSPDGRFAYILTSGRAEGDAKRPAPALEVVDLEAKDTKVVGRLEFDGAKDNPSRISLSKSGHAASVTLIGSDQCASIDLFDPTQPKIIGRAELAEDHVPRLSSTRDDMIFTGMGAESNAVLVEDSNSKSDDAKWVACALPRESSLVFYNAKTHVSLGRFPLHAGALNLSYTRPTALDFDPVRRVLAVANRSGGVHLIKLRAFGAFPETSPALPKVARTEAGTTSR